MSRNTLPLQSGAFLAPLNFPPQATRPPMQLSGMGTALPGVAPQLPRHVQQYQREFHTQMQPGDIPPGRPGNTAGPSTPMTPLSYTLQFQIPAYGGAPSTPISQVAEEWVDGLFEPEASATPVNVVHPVVPHYPVPVPVTPPMQWTSAALLSLPPSYTAAATPWVQPHGPTQPQAPWPQMPMQAMPSVLSPPAYSLEALADATSVDAVLMVGGEFARLLGQNQLEAAGQVLKHLAKKIDAWLCVDPDKEWERGLELRNVMDRFPAPIPAHLRGTCHFHSSLTLSSPWCLGLRFLVKEDRLLWHMGVLDRWAPDLRNSVMRRDALKSLIAQLSWIAQPSHKTQHRQAKELDLMDATVKKALDICVKAHAALRSLAEQRAFRDDILAAIAPAYCSLRLADSLLAIEVLPLWLDAPLRKKAQEVVDDPGLRLFPFDKRRQTAASHALSAYTSAELLGLPATEDVVSLGGLHAQAEPLGSAPSVQSDSDSMALTKTTPVSVMASSNATPSGPPAYSPEALAHATPVDAVRMVGKELARLLRQNQLEAAGQVLELLAKKIDAWLYEDPRTERTRGWELRNMMDLLPAPILAHLRGTCHFHSRFAVTSLWCLGLRFLVNGDRLLWHEGVLDHWAPDFRIPVRRQDALKSLIAQLSWIAEPSPKTKARREEERAIMDATLKKALDLWVDAYAALKSLEEQQAFQRDMLAAIAPAYCSLRMANSLLVLAGMPLWLDSLLRQQAQKVIDDPGPRLFPFDKQPQPAPLQSLPAYTSAGLLGLPASENTRFASASSTSATSSGISNERENSSVSNTARKRQREHEVAAPQAQQARGGEARNPSSAVFVPSSVPQAMPHVYATPIHPSPTRSPLLRATSPSYLSLTQGNMSSASARQASQRAPIQAPSFFVELGALQADTRLLSNSIVKKLARQAMVEADLSTRAGLRMYLGQMASLAQLPKTRQFAHTPSERLAGVFVNLTSMAEQCARGASQEWRSESEFWSDVLNEIGSPERVVLRRAMVALAPSELKGHPHAGAFVERFNSAGVSVGLGGGAQASMSARNDTNDTNAWLDSVLVGPPETPRPPGTSAPQTPVPESPSVWLNGFLGD